MTTWTILALAAFFNFADLSGEQQRQGPGSQSEESEDSGKKAAKRKKAEEREERRAPTCKRSPITQRCSFGAAPFETVG